jgi:uncharacterized protein YqjF (DUF2071 family)
MLSLLKRHPFAVEAFFEQSLVFTFAISKDQLENKIPKCLELDTFGDNAFIAVAMVQTKSLRPKGFPKFLGNDFFLIGYRIFVRYTTSQGKRLRGLYIIKSETNKRKMQTLGNVFTKYNYTTTDISVSVSGNTTKIHSLSSGFDVALDTEKKDIALPVGSPFTDWKDARKFSGPLPFTFTYDEKSGNVLIIEGVRENWHPEPVHVIDYHFAFLDNLGLNEIKLANAFVIRNIPYYWKKGKIDRWKQ